LYEDKLSIKVLLVFNYRNTEYKKRKERRTSTRLFVIICRVELRMNVGIASITYLSKEARKLGK